MIRRKSLLIGINYTGTHDELHGCHRDVENVAEFISYRGYSREPADQVILRDDRSGPFYPSGHNILAAMDWLVAQPNTCCFLHYSGHGGQVPSKDSDHGFNTIVPVDFKHNGQIGSDILHRHLVSRLPPNSTLFALFDCCHSGSVLELPFVYRSDEHGNIKAQDEVDLGANIVENASHFITGGFSMRSIDEVKDLYDDSRVFFKGLLHLREPGPDGLGEQHSAQHWEWEKKKVTVFSGCRDDQTSATANIQGVREGALSWAFLEVMKHVADPTYEQTLKDTRDILKKSKYAQIAQLSVGTPFDLNQPIVM